MNDFYNFINNDWINTEKICSDQSRTTTFDKINQTVNKQLIEILTNELSNINTSLLGKIYNKLLNEHVTIDQLIPYCNFIDQINCLNDYISVLGFMSSIGISILFNIVVGQNIRTGENTILFKQTASFSNTHNYVSHESEYEKFLIKYCNLCNIDNSGIYELENNIGEINMKLNTMKKIWN